MEEMESLESNKQATKDKKRQIKEKVENAENCNGHREDSSHGVSGETLDFEDVVNFGENSNRTVAERGILAERRLQILTSNEFSHINGHGSHVTGTQDRTWCRRSAGRQSHTRNDSTLNNTSSGRKLTDHDGRVDGNIHQQDYTRNVCDMYRHENDVIFGRTRGGVLRNSSQMELVVSPDLENGHGSDMEIRYEELLNGNISSDDSDCQSRPPDGSKRRQVTAPLAIPESFSDEESSLAPSETSSSKKLQICRKQNRELACDNESLINTNGIKQDSEMVSCDVSGYDENALKDAESKDENEGDHEADESGNSIVDHDNKSNETVNGCPVEGESTVNTETDMKTDDVTEHCELTSEPSDDEGNCADEIEEDLGVSGVEDNNIADELAENVLENGVEQIDINNALLLNEQQTEDDSGTNDDNGDFIEADLPPNVERLLFFSRDSTSDEDEGCGDEVLPTNDEDVVSDNETIDPTDAEYVSPSRVNEPKVLNDSFEKSNSGACNILSNHVGQVRSELSNTCIYPCNISCDKSTEENDLDEEKCYTDSGNSPDSRVVECSGCSVQNGKSSSCGDRNSGSVKGDNVCACCDRPVELDCERQKEMGVIVCDQCFREHNLEQNRWSENLFGARRKSRPSSGSNSNFNHRNPNNSMTAMNNHYEKVSNNSPLYGRFSSSDSDPFDRIYVSDSSEMVSPELEAVIEPDFAATGQSNSDASDVQMRQKSDKSKDENHTFHRQSVSLEFTSPEEVLYCPYYTRRSRSLDHYLRLDDEESDNRSNECDVPNITIENSNFQDAESNQQEKVFVKQAYNVTQPDPGCSSSDEEENIRMPGTGDGTADISGASGWDNVVYNQLGGALLHEYVENSDYAGENRLFQMSVLERQGKGQKHRLEESEPIYEDIDQLGLLLDEACSNRGDTVSDSVAAQPLCNAISKLRRKRRARSPVSDVEKVMIWKEYEAYLVQVKQIGTSACGPTAVLNVLKAFDFQVDKEEVVEVVKFNMRMEAAPIPYYLFSRYSAGTTAVDLVEGVFKVTRGAIRGRFFHFYPHRDVQLLKWLGHWMKKGAVPVATLNLQRGVKPGWTIPDAWHHQMVYGVSSKGVYLTNPLEIVPECVILEQLTSDSVLLVRRQDVVGRFRDWCPLNEIVSQPDTRWRTMNVLGQVIHMLREQCMPLEQLVTMKAQLTSHIRIPAAYKAGISLFMRANSDNLHELMSTPELPVSPLNTDS